MLNYYQILGVSKDATTEQIRQAYYDLARKHHPDKGNGNGVEFIKICEAYKVLSNASKRKEYDLTGKVLSDKSLQGLAIQNIISVFTVLIQKDVPKGGDVIQALDSAMNQNIDLLKTQKAEIVKNITRMRKINKGILYKKKMAGNVLSDYVDNCIKSNEADKVELTRKIKSFQRAKVILKDYSYNVEQETDPTMLLRSMKFSFSGTAGSTTDSVAW